ncbi:MAG: hypothetical protein IJY55_04815 [Clostridia bacterium]|nr:hypothetical protein [Clostridia bacterium]
MRRKYYKKYELPESAAPAPIVAVNPIMQKISQMNLDDIIIPILIFLMLTEENPDYITIAALAFIFFA